MLRLKIDIGRRKATDGAVPEEALSGAIGKRALQVLSVASIRRHVQVRGLGVVIRRRVPRPAREAARRTEVCKRQRLVWDEVIPRGRWGRLFRGSFGWARVVFRLVLAVSPVLFDFDGVVLYLFLLNSPRLCQKRDGRGHQGKGLLGRPRSLPHRDDSPKRAR